MGILDEAIREHLELKRKHGAAENDLKRLEDEAFGLPARPGEPDFAPVAAEPAEPRDAAADGDREDDPEDLGEAPAAVLEPEVDEVEAGAEEPEDDEPPPLTGEEPTALFDQGPGDFDFEDVEDVEDLEELDELDLELEDEPGPAAVEAPAAAPSEPGTSLGETADSPAVADEHEGTVEPADAEGEEPVGEDVLADTPDFLRDAPEDDELWFEQGEPQDFDFDE